MPLQTRPESTRYLAIALRTTIHCSALACTFLMLASSTQTVTELNPHVASSARGRDGQAQWLARLSGMVADIKSAQNDINVGNWLYGRMASSRPRDCRSTFLLHEARQPPAVARRRPSPVFRSIPSCQRAAQWLSGILLLVLCRAILAKACPFERKSEQGWSVTCSLLADR